MTQNEIDTGFAGLQGRGRKKQDPPIERELYLTLEEVYKGCTKKMKISRRVGTRDGALEFHRGSCPPKIPNCIYIWEPNILAK